MNFEIVKNRYINLYGAQILKDLENLDIETIAEAFQTESFNNFYAHEIKKYYYKKNNKSFCKAWSQLCKIKKL
jgi:hypothetical protein